MKTNIYFISNFIFSFSHWFIPPKNVFKVWNHLLTWLHDVLLFPAMVTNATPGSHLAKNVIDKKEKPSWLTHFYLEENKFSITCGVETFSFLRLTTCSRLPRLLCEHNRWQECSAVSQRRCGRRVLLQSCLWNCFLNTSGDLWYIYLCSTASAWASLPLSQSQGRAALTHKHRNIVSSYF